TGTHWDISVPVTSKDILWHLLLLQDIYNGAPINHVFWSISVEWRIYFLFPLLVLCWKRFGGIATTVAAIIVGYLLFFALRGTPYVGITPWYLALFAFGMAGAGVVFLPDGPW